jgi:mRNA interferase YafQ
VLKPVETAKFKRDLKRSIKRGKDIGKLKTVIKQLAFSEPLPHKNKDHALGGNWKGYRECHVEPDWLLIYLPSEKEGLLYLTRTGSHSDLFDE